MRPRVALDLDGVCVDWDSSARRALRDVFHEDPGPGPSLKWDALKHQVSVEAWLWLWSDEGLCHMKDLVPDEETVAAVNRLRSVADVSILTARPAGTWRESLRVANALGLSDVCFVDSLAAKANEDFDVWIDDAPEAIEALFRKMKRVIVFDQPWNREESYHFFEGCTRARSWDDVVKQVERFAERFPSFDDTQEIPVVKIPTWDCENGAGIIPSDGERAGAEASVRIFETGATRDVDHDKYDYEAFFSPVVLECFAKYMHEHRFQKDGTVRDGDNWQKGMPFDAYMKSAFRHFMDWWLIHRGYPAVRPESGANADLIDALCALLFNVQGYLHRLLT